MFAKSKISQSMIDAVNSVITEDKKRLINDAEMDETGFHKAAHAAKKSGQSHFEFQGKKYPATAKSHKESIEEVEEAAEKVPTSTGMKVYGSSYGDSAKARRDQVKHSVDDVKGPKTKELKAMDKEPKKNLDEDGDCITTPQAKKIAKKEVKGHEKKLHHESFAAKLIAVYENKTAGTDPVFTDNNIGESEMTDKQKAKREKIVMSMKSGEAGMKQRYGKNWKNVMYATATKQAMKEDSSDVYEGEELDEEDRSDALEKQRKDNVTKSMKAMGKNDRQIKYVHKKTDDVIKKAAGEKVKEEVELDEATPPKGTDIADKAYLKHKPGTVKGQLTQIGRFLRGKPEIKESNDSHTHAAHYENDKGEWTGMNLFTAKDDDDAIKQAQSKCKEGCKLSKVERHTTVKEEVITEAEVTSKEGDTESHSTDMLSGRVKGVAKTNSFKNYKSDLKTGGGMEAPEDEEHGEDTKEKQKITTNPGPVDIKTDDKLGNPMPQKYFSSEHQITHEEVQVDEKVIAGTSGWEKMKKDVKDKSGSVHTPMSRAKHLARQAFKKIKTETMMGKISN